MSGTSDDPLLSVDRLAIAFRTSGAAHEAVRDASFGLRRGHVLALVGESGSGKSVTAMATLGLLPPTARVTGSIRLAGEELVGADPGRLRQIRGGRIGTIFQEPTSALNPVFTVGDQIAEAIRVHRDYGRSTVRARVRELLDTVGLDAPERIARSYPHQLSGGQLQRAMIAMAISCEPELLIADEPTTALDVTVQAGILDLMRDLRSRLDMAILLITHDMGVVADLADDVVVLRQGEVVERAPVGTLFAAPGHPYTRALLDAVPRLVEMSGDAGETDAGPVAGVDADADVDASADAAGAVVALRDTVVTYPGRRGSGRLRAVDGVRLHVGAGEVLGLVGESGSGKSTVARAVAGLVPVTSGEVRVAGVDVAHASRHGRAGGRSMRAVRARMGIVYQDPASSLNPRWTVGDSIAEPVLLHTDVRGPALARRVDELLDAVALPVALRGRHPHELSGGQRQRVAIARALALDPALLIADEPTSALDVSVQATILALLRDLREEFGFACLFISHDLAVVAQLADQVAVMHRGRIVEQGPTADVMRAPRDPYTRRLLSAAPVADPQSQARRREEWRSLSAASPAA
ncbi:ABC transporter ATP-binding protein [Rugosimonospora africana]|uniref:ABC transporter ATP-binding protein n=1 Tax=Rugosimonospora africana TaxID=556532 RepID=A0A8J3QT67_9ACTN|nr:ABC transporter ATP-binding protein [Rugosimonospora africana]GIH15562.1 ABC transporter ATP-binding protein [Rugosimonospora africana]